MKLLLASILIGNLTVTSYRSVPSQTDSTPNHTSAFNSPWKHVQHGGVALSRDLLCKRCMNLHKRCERPIKGTQYHYGDWLYIQGFGMRFVNDCMGAYSVTKINGKVHKRKIEKQIDIWVETYEEEKQVGWNKNVPTWLILAKVDHSATQNSKTIGQIKHKRNFF